MRPWHLLVYNEGRHALKTLAQLPSPRAEEAVRVGGDGHNHEQGHADDVAVGIRHNGLLRAATCLHRHLPAQAPRGGRHRCRDPTGRDERRRQLKDGAGRNRSDEQCRQDGAGAGHRW